MGDDSQGFLNSINFTVDGDETLRIKEYTCFGQNMVIDIDLWESISEWWFISDLLPKDCQGSLLKWNSVYYFAAFSSNKKLKLKISMWRSSKEDYHLCIEPTGYDLDLWAFKVGILRNP